VISNVYYLLSKIQEKQNEIVREDCPHVGKGRSAERLSSRRGKGEALSDYKQLIFLRN
jgi:hypothetical protein